MRKCESLQKTNSFWPLFLYVWNKFALWKKFITFFALWKNFHSSPTILKFSSHLAWGNSSKYEVDGMRSNESTKNGQKGAHGLNCKIFVNFEVIFEIYDKNYHRKKFSCLRQFKIFCDPTFMVPTFNSSMQLLLKLNLYKVLHLNYHEANIWSELV